MKSWRIAVLLLLALPLLGAGSKKGGGSGDALVTSPLTQFDSVTTITDTQFCQGNGSGGFDCDEAGELDNDDLSDNSPVDLNNVTDIVDGEFCQGNALSGFDCDQALTNEHLDWTGSVGTVHAGNVGAAHIDALTEFVMCVGSGTSVIELDNAGTATCKASVQTTITAVGDGDILVGQASGTEFQDKQMNGDATMDKGGLVTLDPALTFLTTGTIRGMVDVVTTTGDTDSPAADDMRGTMHIADNATATNNVDYTLPTAVAGMSACFYDNGAGTGGIIIDANTGDEILLNGTGVGGADAIDSPGVAGDGANGDFICLLAIDATNWITLGRSGTWVDGGAN